MEAAGLQVGVEGRTERVVDESLLTRHVGGAGVFATPMMILLMEQTAHDSVKPFIGSDNTTVGYEVHVRHLAPVEPGEMVLVTSRLESVQGNRLRFAVACSRGETLVGTGEHKRAVLPLRSR
ncbi:MAG: thioesterase [Candidatus Dormibacteraeota bacterium]|nr:thioesterase [Candidatus Dormibacteraeota bacterium]